MIKNSFDFFLKKRHTILRSRMYHFLLCNFSTYRYRNVCVLLSPALERAAKWFQCASTNRGFVCIVPSSHKMAKPHIYLYHRCEWASIIVDSLLMNNYLPTFLSGHHSTNRPKNGQILLNVAPCTVQGPGIDFKEYFNEAIDHLVLLSSRCLHFGIFGPFIFSTFFQWIVCTERRRKRYYK